VSPVVVVVVVVVAALEDPLQLVASSMMDNMLEHTKARTKEEKSGMGGLAFVGDDSSQDLMANMAASNATFPG